MIGIHPSEMHRAENQARFSIHPYAVGSSAAVTFPDALDDGKERPAPLTHFLSVKSFTRFARQLLDHQRQPKRRVGRFAVRVVIAKKSVRNRAVLFM